MMIRPLVAALALFAAGSAHAQDDLVKAGATVYKKCQACHAVGEGAKNKVGPQQNNIFGRVAGSLPDFKYSQAMMDAGKNGLVWTDASLAAYLKAPKAYIPGNKMAFAGLKKDQDIAAVTAYLKTFDTDGLPPEGASTYQTPTQ